MVEWENLFEFHFDDQKYHTDWPGIEWGKKLNILKLMYTVCYIKVQFVPLRS